MGPPLGGLRGRAAGPPSRSGGRHRGRWIIATDHPDLVPAAWEAFAAAGDVLDDPVTQALLEVLPAVRLLEAIHVLRFEAQRRTWLERLRTTLDRLHAG